MNSRNGRRKEKEGIAREIDRIWEKQNGDRWRQHARLTVREFPAYENEQYPIVAVHNTLRDQWEAMKKQLADEREKGEKNCELDDPDETREDYIRWGNLFFRTNCNPTLEGHVFIKTGDHRELPKARDHETIIDFVNLTDYAVFLNLRNSGAGIPDHLHYQGHKREYFPLLKRQSQDRRIRSYGSFELAVREGLNCTLVVNYNDEARKLVAEVTEYLGYYISSLGLGYNLIFDKNRIFLFPRKCEIAPNIPQELAAAGMDKWKIAGQEMGLLFSAKFKPVLEMLNYGALADALKDVTIPSWSEREEFYRIVANETTSWLAQP